MHKNHSFHLSLKLILRNAKSEILLLKMPDTSSMAGYYDLPGGRISEGEHTIPFRESIKREIIEELGPEIDYKVNMKPVSYGINSIFSNDENKEIQVLMIFFESEYKGGNIKISNEHSEYSWEKISKDNLKKYFVRGFLEGMENYFNFNQNK